MNICPRTNRTCEITGCNGNNPNCHSGQVQYGGHSTNAVFKIESGNVNIKRHTESDIVNEFARRMKERMAVKDDVTMFDVLEVEKAVRLKFGLP